MSFPTPSATSLHPSDSELIDQALAGDQKAFRHLVNRYLPIVYNYLYRMTNNTDTSEEISQEAFVKAYKHLNSFDRTRPFKPWLLRIASNTAITELRKQSKVVSLDAMAEEGSFTEADHVSSEGAEAALERKLDNAELMKAMNKLDQKYRQVLLLRYQQDLSYEEIADALSIPLNTVRTWLKRGLEKLKTQVSEGAH